MDSKVRISIEEKTGRFRLHSDLIHRPAIQTVFGAAYRGGAKDYWTIPPTYASAVQLATVLGEGNIEYEPEVAARINIDYERTVGLYNSIMNMDSALIKQVQNKCTDLGFMPRDFQVKGIVGMGNLQRVIEGDEQGTGKMVQGALALKLYAPDTLPAVVVAPSGVIHKWQRTLEAVGLTVTVMPGSMVAAKRRTLLESFDTEVLVTTYPMLIKHSRLAPYGPKKLTDEQKTLKEFNFIPWATVIMDEAHRITSTDSQQTLAAWALRTGAKFRWPMSGTPVEQSPMQLWALLHFIDPEAYPSSTKFMDRYVDMDTDYFGKVTINGIKSVTLEEFHLLTDSRIIRRLKKDVLPELPAKTYETYEYELPAKLRAVYKGIASGKPVKMEDGTILETFSGVERYTRGLQAAASALSVTTTTDEEGKVIQHVRMVEPCPKLDALEAFLEDEPPGKPYVCWFVNRDLMAMTGARFEKAGRTFVEYHGDKTAQERDDAVEAFQRGDVQFFLCQVQAGAEGTTLTRSDTALYIQQPGSFILTSQSEDRVHRMGSEVHDSIRNVRFVASDTDEAEIALKIERKQGISDQMFTEMGLT